MGRKFGWNIINPYIQTIMRIKNTAFIHNVTVNGSSNCDWGTDIGQGSKHTFTLSGFPEILNAMVYYKIEDEDNIEVILGKGNRTPKPVKQYVDTKLVLASCFKKVFVNEKELKGERFVMYIVKETNEFNSKGKVNVHKDRCTLKFSNSLLYRGEMVNQSCIDAISEAFGLSKDGSWAILEMTIQNEDELHFTGFALGNTAKVYNSVEQRNDDFARRMGNNNSLKEDLSVKPSDKEIELYDEEYNYISAIKTKPFLIFGGFSGTGKSIEVKTLAFVTCPCDGVLNVSETSPGNYLLISVKPNWHDATDITGFRSSVQNKYYVTDFMRFLVKAKMYEDKNVPFFVCLDEMNLAPVEEYFADFLSVIESRKRRSNGKIVTDPIVPASVFNEKYAADYNIFMDMGLKPVAEGMTPDEIDANEADGQNENFERQDIVDELKAEGLTIPQNMVIIGTVNMDDTTNTFSRKVIDRAMTFETVVGTFGKEYFDGDLALHYIEHPRKGELFISDEVRATEMLTDKRFELTAKEESDILAFINDINKDLAGTPFLVSYRILNETILLYRSRQEIYRLMNDGNDFEEGVEYSTDLNDVFDDILMQKVLPRIEGDYEKCNDCLVNLLTRAKDKAWYRSEEKIEFMLKRFGSDKSGFTSFWN